MRTTFGEFLFHYYQRPLSFREAVALEIAFGFDWDLGTDLLADLRLSGRSIEN